MLTAQNVIERKGADVATVNADHSVKEAADLMNARRIGAVVVTEGDRVIGIFTERDILCRVVATERSASKTNVREVMTTPTACCRPDTLLAECQGIMIAKRIRHLPVVDDGKLVGIISAGDVMAIEAAQQQQTIEYLHEYLYSAR
jgi:CBS domain-containing protein